MCLMWGNLTVNLETGSPGFMGLPIFLLCKFNPFVGPLQSHCSGSLSMSEIRIFRLFRCGRSQNADVQGAGTRCCFHRNPSRASRLRPAWLKSQS